MLGHRFENMLEWCSTISLSRMTEVKRARVDCFNRESSSSQPLRPTGSERSILDSLPFGST